MSTKLYDQRHVVPIYYSGILLLFKERKGMELTIVQGVSGYTVSVHDYLGSGSHYQLYAERSQKVRCFKTAEAAFKVCRSLGANRVQVVLP